MTCFYREKKIISGAVLEILQERCTPTGRVINRNRTGRETSEAQKRVNLENAKKDLMRILNTNFVKGDYFITLCYEKEPASEAEAAVMLRNFMRKLRILCKKVTGEALRYITVTERGDKYGRIHHHIVCQRMPVELQQLWKLWGNGRVDMGTLDGDPYYEWMMIYLTKQDRTCKSKRRWSPSKNLKKPVEPPHKVIKRKDLRRPVKAPKGYYVMDYRHYADSYSERRYIICIKQDRKADIPEWLLNRITELPENGACS